MIAVAARSQARAAANDRDAFYRELGPLGVRPLWPVLSELLTSEPRVKAVPYIWRYRELRPRLLHAGSLVSAEQAERRVLMLINPGLGGKIGATATLFAGLQLVLPGEIARCHRHTPAAFRFIVEGDGGYTAVEGEKTLMSKGDFVTTPAWTWHDHGNDSPHAMMWLDGLDLPLVAGLDATFFEPYEDDRQPLVSPMDDSQARWAANLRPSGWGADRGGPASPVLSYRWDACREALHALREQRGSDYDGVLMEYTNPCTGGPVLPTMGAYLQLLRNAEHTQAHRHVASTVYHVAEGAGFSMIAGACYDWEEGDTFAVPAWTWHEHAAVGSEAVLFSFSDRPALRALGLDREEALPA